MSPANNLAAPTKGRTLSHPATPPPSVMLRFLGTGSITVRGLMTGKPYFFSAAQPVQAVASPDAEALLRTRYFRRDYGR